MTLILYFSFKDIYIFTSGICLYIKFTEKDVFQLDVKSEQPLVFRKFSQGVNNGVFVGCNIILCQKGHHFIANGLCVTGTVIKC